MKSTLWLVLIVISAPVFVAAEGPPPPPAEPAEVLLLGTFHFSDAGLDSYRPEHDIDITSKERQEELDVVLQCLEQFAPTRIGLERKWSDAEGLNEQYRSYLEGEFELTSNEIHQIGFRLARRLGHDEVYAIDAERRFYDPYVDPTEYAIEHGQADQLQSSEAKWEEYYTSLYTWDDAAKMKRTLVDHLLYVNSEQRIVRGHGHYLVGSFKAGAGDDYPGVDAKIAWYNRNLRIFANIQRITRSPGERIVVVIGSGHLPILRHAVEASPEYDLVEVSEVLFPPCE